MTVLAGAVLALSDAFFSSPLPSPWTNGTEACVSKSANSALSVTMNNKNEKINEKSPLLCAFQLNWGQRDSVFTDV